MAKKQKFKLDDQGFPSEDLDFDMGSMDFDPAPVANDRSPVINAASAVVGGVRDAVRGPSFYQKLLRESLPSGYGEAIDVADNTTTALKNLYNDAAQEMRPVIRDLKRTTKRIIPSVEGVLPKVILEKIKSWTESDPERADYSPEAQRESGMQAQLADIFKFQTEMGIKDKAEADAKSTINEGVAHARHQSQNQQLDAIRVSLSQIANYQSKIESGFQRKSLEVQFRHFFATSDLLVETKRQNAKTTEFLQDIRKNTGLPDYVKLSEAEFIKQQIRSKMSGFVGRVIGNVGSVAKEKLGKVLSDASSAISGVDSAADVVDMDREMRDMGVDTGGVAGMIGGGVGGMIADSIGTRLGKYIKKKTSNHKGVTDTFSKISYAMNNLPQLGASWAKENEYGSGVFGTLKEIGADAINKANAKDTLGVTHDTMKTLSEPGVFSNKANKSITEIIPGLLSRIHHELRMTRTGNDKLPMVEYDFMKDRFSTTDKIKDSIKETVFNKEGREYTKQNVEALVNEILPNGTPEQKTALGAYLLKKSLQGPLDVKTLRDSFNYDGEAEPHADVFANAFDSRYADDADFSKRAKDSRAIKHLGNSIKAPEETIQTLTKYGYKQHLEDLKLIRANHKASLTNSAVNIDHDQINDFYVPKFKKGGKHKGGARIVGEDGPELEVTGPSSISNAKQTSDLFESLKKSFEENSSKSGVETTNETLLRIESELKNTVAITNAIRAISIESVKNSSMMFKQMLSNKVADTVGRVKASGLYQQGAAQYNLYRPMAEHYASKAKTAATEYAKKFSDVYLKGELEPRLLAWKLEAGLYRDMVTNQVIKSYKDIKGAIIDMSQKDSEGNPSVILTAENLKEAFIKTKAGVKLLSAVTDIKDYAKNLYSQGFFTKQGLYNAGVETFQRFAAGMKVIDIYVKGNKQPVLLASGMTNGDYFSQTTGKVIQRVADIDGPVMDKTKKVLISQEMIDQGLFDIDGNAISLKTHNVTRPFAKGFDALKSVSSAVANTAKDAIDSVGNLFGNGMRNLQFVNNTLMIKRLTEVRNLLNHRLEGKPTDFNESDNADLKELKMGMDDRPGLMKRTFNRIKTLFRRERSDHGILYNAAADLIGMGVGTVKGISRTATKGVRNAFGLANKVVTGAAPYLGKGAMKLLSLGAKAAPAVTGAIGNMAGGIQRNLTRAVNLTRSTAQAGMDIGRAALPTMKNLGAKAAGHAVDGLSSLGNMLFSGGGLAGKVAGGALNFAKGAGGFLLDKLGIGSQAKKQVSLLTEIRDLLAARLPAPRRHVVGDIDGSGIRAGSAEDQRRHHAADGEMGPSSSGVGTTGGRGGFLGAIAGMLGAASQRRKEAAAAKEKEKAEGGGAMDTLENAALLQGGMWGTSKLGQGIAKVAGGAGRVLSKVPYLRAVPGVAKLAGMGLSAAGIGTAAAGAGAAGVAGAAAKSGIWSKLGTAAKFGGRFLGGAGAAYGAYSAYDNFKKGHYGDAAVDAGLGLMSGAGMVGSLGAMGTTAGSALAGAGGIAATALGALSLPVILAGLAIAGAVAGVGYGLYKGYKYLSRHKLDTLSTVRYAQYGFPASDQDHLQQVMGLEDLLMKAVVYDGNMPKIDDSKLDKNLNNDLWKMFDIDPKDADDEGKRIVMSKWMVERFKPVFLNSLLALRNVNPQVALKDIDTKLTPDQKIAYLRQAKFSNGPYDVRHSPFIKEKAPLLESDAVATVVRNAEEKLKQDAEKAKTDKSGMSATAAPVVAGAAAAGAGLLDDSKSMMKGKKSEVSGKEKAAAASLLAIASKEANDASGMNAATKYSDIVSMTGRFFSNVKDFTGTVAALIAVRYKTYGLKEMSPDKMRALDSLEDLVVKDITFNRNNTATWSSSVEKLITSAGPIFGIDGPGSAMASDWVYWFNRRFLPVYLNYLTQLMLLTGKKNPNEAVLALKPSQMIDVANAMTTSVGSNFGSSTRVWDVTTSPWAKYELNTDINSVEENVNAIKALVKATALAEEKAAKSGVGNKSSQPKYEVTMLTPNAPAMDTVAKPSTPTATPDAGKVTAPPTSGMGGILNPNASPSSSGVPTPTTPTPTSDPSTAPTSGGGAIDTSIKGTGGAIDSIPQPKGDGSYAAYKDMFAAIGQMIGIDPNLLATMAAIESNFSSKVKAGSSSAKGLFQFISGTWDMMVKNYGAKFGISPNTPASDPRANAIMGALYSKENMRIIQPALKRPVTDTDVYAAHFLGPGDALKMFKAKPDEIAANVLRKAAASNPNIFYEKGTGRPRTIAELYNHLNQLVKSKGKKFGLNSGGQDLAVTKATTPSAVQVASADTGTAAPAKSTTPGTESTTSDASPAQATPTKTAVAPASAPASAPAIPVSNQSPGLVQPVDNAPMANVEVSTTPSGGKLQPAQLSPAVLRTDSGGISDTYSPTAFTPQRRTAMEQNNYRRESENGSLGDVAKTLADSRTIQTNQLEALKRMCEILDKRLPAGGMADNASKGNSNQDNTSVQTQSSSSQNTAPADNVRRPMSKVPVSMSKTIYS